MSEEFNEEQFNALRFMVNYARSQNHCRLTQVKARACEAGFSREAVDAATKMWADYEASKRG